MGEAANMETIRPIMKEIRSMKVGDPVTLVIRRGDKEIPLTITLQPRIDRHIFEETANLTEDQKSLREAWCRNFISRM
jgi:hypothetical protein